MAGGQKQKQDTVGRSSRAASLLSPCALPAQGLVGAGLGSVWLAVHHSTRALWHCRKELSLSILFSDLEPIWFHTPSMEVNTN